MLLLVSALAVLAVFDVATTSTILEQGGIELNPFVLPFVSSPIAFLLLKSLYLASVLLMIAVSRRLHPSASEAVLLVSCGIAIHAVVWNCLQLLIYP